MGGPRTYPRMSCIAVRSSALHLHSSALKAHSPASLRSRSLLAGELHRGGDVDLDDLGHARLRHGDAHQLARELHGDLVVRDEEELRLAGHLAHQLAEAL